ncbi:MAG: glycine--tRNA ligase subunit beta [Actinobacteria bacterium HGW-Actinobacteria-7]|nr:MAG: glycine--tRNA ligase subunit beta [Actinobacteria bacterium HGW-Actinobacteria-7]
MSGRDLIYEIGTEELPSSAVYSAIEQLQVSVPKALDDTRLGYGEIAVLATPRRIAVLVSELADSQADAVTVAKGPAAKAAFDAEGKPTQAAMGFARGKGVAVESLEVREENGASYVYATVETIGGPAANVLPELLARLTENLDWAKSQRWGSGTARFPRPVRWLLALHGADIVPVEFAGLTAGRVTFGHRFLAPGEIAIGDAGEYSDALRGAFVAVDHNERARMLREGIEAAAHSYNGTAVVPDKTFAEVVNLVEWPTVGVGTFDEQFLEVPREMLEYAMGGHQRYFPLQRDDGMLDNRFIVAHNGAADRTEQIIRGHERVIRARLADAAFFYKEDLATTLEEWAGKLGSVVFQAKLGTVAEKVARIEQLVVSLGQMLGTSADQAAFGQRAAHLCKADLVTNAVVEFTDLQGVMGRYYALAGGEEAGVALAIEEHYRPRFAGDQLPTSEAGRLVSIADKTDTICGIFAAGKAPKGSADPFALRRHAIGILQMALDGSPVKLDALIGEALSSLASHVVFDVDETGAAIKEFLLTRLQTILRDRGHAYDTVDAILAVSADDPADALARCEALTLLRASSDDMEDLSVAYTRAKNLAKPELGVVLDRAVMAAEELALADALDASEKMATELMAQHAYSAALESLVALRGPIDAFFDAVLVMDPDVKLRDNRLRLLNRFVSVFGGFADFSKLSG